MYETKSCFPIAAVLACFLISPAFAIDEGGKKPMPPPNTLSIFKSPLAGLPLEAGKRPSNALLLEKMYAAKTTNARYEVGPDGTVSVTGSAHGELHVSDGVQLLGLRNLSVEVNLPREHTGCVIELELRFDPVMTNRRPPFLKKIELNQNHTASDDWRAVRLLDESELPADIDALAIAYEGGGIHMKVTGFSETVALRFRPPVAEFADGRRLSLYDINATDNIYSTSLRKHGRKPYQAAPWVILGGVWSADFARHLQSFYPHIGISHFGSTPRMDDLADTLAGERIRVLPEDTPWLYNQKKHLWLESAAQFDQDGVPRLAMHDANIFLPGAFGAARDVIDHAARAGRDAVILADWIWPWYGRFGFDPVSVAAFREILREADDGIVLTFAEGKRHWKFWDYFDYYHAFRWQPHNLGYEDWNDFVPLPEAVASEGGETERKRFLLYTALYHYAHLQFTQKVGLYAHQKGLRLELVPNPEEAGNGNDLLLFARLDGVDNLFAEYFYVPESLVPGYYNLGYLARAAGETGFDLSLQLETGFGGSILHYWESENYLPFTYLLTAGGAAAQLKIDFLKDAGVHSRDPDDPRHEHYRRIRFMLHGFQLAKEDRARKPESSVMNIQRRSIHSQFTAFEIGLRGSGNFGAALAENNIAFDGWGMEEADLHLDNYTTIFLGGWQPTVRLMHTVSKWLDSDGKRILVTHSAIPFETDQGAYNIRKGIQWASWQNMVHFGDWMLEPSDADGRSAALGIEAAHSVNGMTVVSPLVRTPAGESREFTAPISPLDYWVTTKGEHLITSDPAENKPLVSVFRRANGARIVYLHYTPGREETRHLDSAVMDLLGDWLALLRNGRSERYYILPANIEGGRAYALHERTASYDFSITHNLFGANPRTWIYPYKGASNVEALILRADPNKKYMVYDWMTDSISSATSDQKGDCTIQFGKTNTGLIYLLEDTEKGRHRLAALKVLRARCGDILPPRSEIDQKE